MEWDLILILSPIVYDTFINNIDIGKVLLKCRNRPMYVELRFSQFSML
jgi:hypothetical protein